MNDKWKTYFGKLNQSSENEAPEALWENLEAQLDEHLPVRTTHKRSLQTYWLYAGVAAVLFVGVWIGFSQWPTSQAEVAKQSQELPSAQNPADPIAETAAPIMEEAMEDATYIQEQKEQLENAQSDIAMQAETSTKQSDTHMGKTNAYPPPPSPQSPPLTIATPQETYNLPNAGVTTAKADKKEVRTEKNTAPPPTKPAAVRANQAASDQELGYATEVAGNDVAADELSEVIILKKERDIPMSVTKNRLHFFGGKVNYTLVPGNENTFVFRTENKDYPKEIRIEKQKIEFLDNPKNANSRRLIRLIRKDKKAFLALVTEAAE